MAPLLPLPIPKLMTYQREISKQSVEWGHTISRGSLWFTAISRNMMKSVSNIGTWRLVYNGVPLSRYDFCPDPGRSAPLVFLGRIEEIKGPHLAIEIARRAGIPLILAGNVETEHRTYFLDRIIPQLDGVQANYIGPVDDQTKNALLKSARALLMPILWEEPFGIVMAEAMACGTPVIGFGRGAVSEVVEDGVTGFVVNDVDDFVEAVRRLDMIDRAECRARVERLFSDRAIIEAYEKVYAEMLVAAGRKTCVY